jgi:hypothetical protein
MKYFVIIFIFLFSLESYSCSCGSRTVSNKFAQSEFVAKGKIIKNYKNKGKEKVYKSDIIIYDLYKGPKLKSIYVYGNNGSSIMTSCDIFISEDTELIFYAYKSTQGKYTVGMCSGLVYLNHNKKSQQIISQNRELNILNSFKTFENKNFNETSFYSKDLHDNLRKIDDIKLKKSFGIFEIIFDGKLNVLKIQSISNFGNKYIDKKVINILESSSWEFSRKHKEGYQKNQYRYIIDIYYYPKEGENKSFLSIFNL